MALYDGFFDAILDDEDQYDRTYDSDDFTQYFGQMIGSGVCIYSSQDSMKVRMENNGPVLSPGYLFIQGYWLCNTADYSITTPGTFPYAVCAHLNLAQRTIEIITPAPAAVPSNSLTLAFINGASEPPVDKRSDPDACGLIDSSGNLAAKIEFALDYIDNQIEAKLEQVEQEINDQSAKLDSKIEQVNSLVERLAPPPIGAVKYSAVSPGNEWLICDGSLINEDDYPELVKVLGKYLPGVDEFWNAASNIYTGQFSTSYIFDGYMWVYSVDSSKLLGFSLNGGENKSIQASGASGFTPSTLQNPLVLSICGNRAFLTQYKSRPNDILLYECPLFDPTAEKISFSLLDISGLFTAGTFETVPEIVYKNGKFYIALGLVSYSNSPGGYYFTEVANIKSLCWEPDKISEGVEYSTSICQAYRDNSAFSMSEEIALWKKYWGTWLRWNHKCNNELVAGYIYRHLVRNANNYRSLSVASATQGIYAGTSNVVATEIGRVPQEAVSISSMAGNGFLITRCFFKNRNLAIRICSYNPMIPYAYDMISAESSDDIPADDLLIITSIQLPSNAVLFQDSVLYIEAQNLWIVFVGTGILFSHTPKDADSWGYLSTVDTLGNITQFGGVEYDTVSCVLCISGIGSDGIYKAGMLKLKDQFDYATSGAWLPVLSAGGIPGYIKAKEPEEETP